MGVFARSVQISFAFLNFFTSLQFVGYSPISQSPKLQRSHPLTTLSYFYTLYAKVLRQGNLRVELLCKMSSVRIRLVFAQTSNGRLPFARRNFCKV